MSKCIHGLNRMVDSIGKWEYKLLASAVLALFERLEVFAAESINLAESPYAPKLLLQDSANFVHVKSSEDRDLFPFQILGERC